MKKWILGLALSGLCCPLFLGCSAQVEDGYTEEKGEQEEVMSDDDLAGEEDMESDTGDDEP